MYKGEETVFCILDVWDQQRATQELPGLIRLLVYLMQYLIRNCTELKLQHLSEF